VTSAPTQPSAVNCATATCARRLPAAGQLERFSRTSARNPPPTDGRRDSLAPWPRKRPKLEAHPPAGRGPDCPKYRNRFLQKRRVSVLPRARHGRKPGVATDGETAAASGACAKRTFHFSGPCRHAGPARADECDRASGNRRDRKVLRAPPPAVTARGT